MNTILIILVVLLLLGAFPAYSYNPQLGGGVGLLVIILIILLLSGRL